MQEAWSWWPPRNGILSRIMNDTCACMAEIDTLSTSNEKTANESEAYTSNADPTTMLAVVLVIVRDQFRAKFERKMEHYGWNKNERLPSTILETCKQYQEAREAK